MILIFSVKQSLDLLLKQFAGERGKSSQKEFILYLFIFYIILSVSVEVKRKVNTFCLKCIQDYPIHLN